MPGISLNWRRTSTTMDWAALCTALMVKGGEDEGQHGADEHAHQHRGAGQGESSGGSVVFSWTMLT